MTSPSQLSARSPAAYLHPRGSGGTSPSRSPPRPPATTLHPRVIPEVLDRESQDSMHTNNPLIAL